MFLKTTKVATNNCSYHTHSQISHLNPLNFTAFWNCSPFIWKECSAPQLLHSLSAVRVVKERKTWGSGGACSGQSSLCPHAAKVFSSPSFCGNIKLIMFQMSVCIKILAALRALLFFQNRNSMCFCAFSYYSRSSQKTVAKLSITRNVSWMKNLYNALKPGNSIKVYIKSTPHQQTI